MQQIYTPELHCVTLIHVLLWVEVLRVIRHLVARFEDLFLSSEMNHLFTVSSQFLNALLSLVQVRHALLVVVVETGRRQRFESLLLLQLDSVLLKEVDEQHKLRKTQHMMMLIMNGKFAA